MVSTTVIKKRPEIDASPQDENIYERNFFIGHCEASLSGYNYASEAMRTLNLAFVRRTKFKFSVDFSLDQRQTQWRKFILAAHPDSYRHY